MQPFPGIVGMFPKFVAGFSRYITSRINILVCVCVNLFNAFYIIDQSNTKVWNSLFIVGFLSGREKISMNIASFIKHIEWGLTTVIYASITGFAYSSTSKVGPYGLWERLLERKTSNLSSKNAADEFSASRHKINVTCNITSVVSSVLHVYSILFQVIVPWSYN